MQVLLLRHGETQWNHERRCQGITDTHLNDTGLQQARKVAAALSTEKLDAVYASNLKRAVQTAHAIGEPHGLDVISDGDFRELNHGDLEGLTFIEIRETYPEFIDLWRRYPADIVIPGGESIGDVEKRTWRGMDRIIQRHGADERVVVVCHQFPLATILCRITGTPLNRYRSFHIDPCGLARVSHEQARGWKILETKGLDHSER